MPLSELQRDILRLLASHRSPESYVAGATALNQDGPRFSHDIDIFHDREDLVATVSAADAALLNEGGFDITWTRRQPGIHVALVGRGTQQTRLEWVVDSDFRFFPTIPDDLFGYRLHVVDIATNKALAAAGRREPRDVLDLLLIHDRYLPLGAVIWAAVAKDPGFSPESLAGEIRRNAHYRSDDYTDLAVAEPVDATAVSHRLRAALEQADGFIRAMPAGKEGVLFLRSGTPVQPIPDELDAYVPHEGRRRGLWPSSPEISSAMLDRGKS